MYQLQRLILRTRSAVFRNLAIALIALAFVLLVFVHPWAFWAAFIPAAVCLVIWGDRKVT